MAEEGPALAEPFSFRVLVVRIALTGLALTGITRIALTASRVVAHRFFPSEGTAPTAPSLKNNWPDKA